MWPRRWANKMHKYRVKTAHPGYTLMEWAQHRLTFFKIETLSQTSQSERINSMCIDETPRDERFKIVVPSKSLALN